MSVITPIIESIDGESRRIYLKQGVTDFYPIEDIYHEYRYLRRTDESLRKWAPLLRAEGNVPKGGGAFTPRYVVLIDGTKIVPWDESLQLNQLGDMITDDPDSDPSLYDISGLTSAKPIFIKPSESEIIQLNSSAIEYSTFQMSVWLDPSSTNDGTEYPMGNREYPVNNWSDAIAIANARGFARIGLLGNSSLDGGADIQSFDIFGQSHVNTKLVILDSALTQKATFRDLNIEGVLDGGSEINNCMIGDLDYVNGHIHNSSLYGTITLAGGTAAILSNCQVVDLHNLPVIDMGGTGQDLIMTNWKGSLTLRNMTGSSDDISIGMDSGQIILDSTITKGTITLNGVGAVLDNTTGTAQVNHVNLVKGQQLNDLYNITKVNVYAGQVFLDINNGSSGVDLPTGLVSQPVDNLTDALAILALHGGNRIWLAGSLTLDQPVIGYHFKDWVNADIDLNGQTTTGTRFEDLKITGNQSGFSIFTNCKLHSLINMQGMYSYSAFLDTNTNTIASGQTIISDCRSFVAGNDSPTFDISAGNVDLSVRAYSGGFKLLNSNSSGNIATIEFIAGRLNVDDTNILGSLSARGVFSRNDTSGSNYVIDYSGANIQVSEIWDEPIADHLESGSTGAQLATASSGGVDLQLVANAVWDEPLSASNHDIIESAGRRLRHSNIAVEYDNGVTIDVINGSAGTGNEIGTKHNPSNNLADAIAIAEEHDFTRLYIIGSLDIAAAENISGYTLSSERSLGNVVTVAAGATTAGTFFEDLTVAGTMAGSVRYTKCVLGAITNFDGGAKNCLLTDIIRITGAGNNYLTDCDVYVTDSSSFLDVYLNGSSINIIRGRGNFQLLTKTSTDTTSLDLVGGRVKVASNCVSGIVEINGIAEVVDESSAGCTVEINSLSHTAITENVWDAMAVDHTVLGSTGEILDAISYLETAVYINTELDENGNGRSVSPFNNLPDAVDFAESKGWKNLKILSDVTIDRNLKNFIIEGVGGVPVVDLNGQNIDKSEFYKVKLTGEQVGAMTSREVILLNGMSGVNGVYKEAAVVGKITLADNSITTIVVASTFPSDYTLSPCQIDFIAADTAMLSLRKYSGEVEILNMNKVSNVVTAEFASGTFTMGASNTLGTVRLSGLPDTAVHVEGSSTTLITEALFPSVNSIWNADLSEYTQPNSAALSLSEVYNIEKGNWEINNNQMIFKDINNDEMFRVDLFDKNGNPSMSEVFKRVRVE